YNYHFNVNKC
ncbi:hypothetical protein D046_5754, partial [Vibrio parahaemolyticus V-223/04]